MLRAALALLGLLVAALVGSQIALPRVAERRISHDLAAAGEVRHVSVEALPALKLLFKRADRVVIDMAEARTGTGKLAKLLRRTSGAREVDARVDLVHVGRLQLRDVALHKDHNRLSGQATLSDADLAAALPRRLALRPVDDPAGELVLEASAGLVTVRARLSARDGALVIAPEGLLGGLGSLTVFRDSRVHVSSIGSKRGADGFTLTASGRLDQS
ncbi:MAG: LmeA family phospholipid-binding protein [Solirubrobacteraceae bacterium]